MEALFGTGGTVNTSDLANERVFAENKRLCLMGFDSTTLRQRFTERLSRAVPYEGYVAFTMDPSSGLITDALVEEMGNERTTRHFLEDVLFEDDILEFNWMVRNRLPVGSSRRPREASSSTPCVIES